MRMANQKLINTRLNICKSCPLYSTNYGGTCSRNLYINPKTDDISSNPLDGYIQGCGCKVFMKAKIEKAKCPAGKW